MSNKEKLIDLIYKAFNSEDFNFVKTFTIGKNEIKFNKDYLDHGIIKIGKSYKSSGLGRGVRLKVMESVLVPNIKCTISFADNKNSLHLIYNHPTLDDNFYEVKKCEKSLFDKLNIFSTDFIDQFTLKELSGAFSIQFGQIKENITIDEYKDITNKLIDIHRKYSHEITEEELKLDEQFINDFISK